MAPAQHLIISPGKGGILGRGASRVPPPAESILDVVVFVKSYFLLFFRRMAVVGRGPRCHLLTGCFLNKKLVHFYLTFAICEIESVLFSPLQQRKLACDWLPQRHGSTRFASSTFSGGGPRVKPALSARPPG